MITMPTIVTAARAASGWCGRAAARAAVMANASGGQLVCGYQLPCPHGQNRQ